MSSQSRYFEFLNAAAPSENAIAADTASYTNEIVSLLFRLFLDVIRVRQPEIEPVLKGEAAVPAGRSSPRPAGR